MLYILRDFRNTPFIVTVSTTLLIWFKLYFICLIYDKYTNNTEYDYNTTTIQMGFRRKSNDLFESVSQDFT